MGEVSDALRALVRLRAGGRCEYCLQLEATVLFGHQMDHIIAVKHGGQTEQDNLALCCTLCNKHKGSDISSVDTETGAIIPLFHPRRDAWNQHFQLHRAHIVGSTATGRATARLLQFNRSERIRERELFAPNLTS